MSGEQLRIEKTLTSDGTLVRVSGDIEASFEARELTDGLGAGVVVFDLDGVKRITSFGVREWVEALKALGANYYCFTKVRPAMVAQLNMVSGFAGHGALVSLYLPYVCDECDTETEVLTDLRTHFDVVTSATPPPATCPSCGAEAEFDDVPASYFFYAAQNRPPPLPDGATRLVDGKDAPAPTSLSVQKEVDGKLTAVWLQGPISKRARFKRMLDGLEGVTLVVLAGVTNVDTGGMGRVQELLSLEGVDVFLARVPLGVLESVRPKLSLGLAGRLVSFTAPGECPSCGPVSVVVDREGLAQLSLHKALPCPRCERRVPLDDIVDTALGVSSLFARLVPGDVTRYLAARPGSSLAGIAAADVRTGSQSGEYSREQKYEVIRKLGVGGMAEVYLARQRGPQGFVKRVALKTVIGTLARNKQFIDMFLQEARVAAAITHPNVVQIFDLGQDAGRYFIAMEYVRGWDLRTVLTAAKRQGTAMPIELACRVAADAAAGLHAAHTCTDEEGRSLNIVHRDVSPHNVLLSDEGAVKITDFGVSKVQGSLFETRTGQIKGKVLYMAPEQVDPKHGPITASTDVFALGLLLHEMLAGFAIFRRDTELDSIGAVLNSEIPRLTDLRDDLPAVIDDVVQRALQREQSARYPSAQAFHLALHQALMTLSRPATPTHLAQWLKGLAHMAAEAGDMAKPSVTPTGEMTASEGTIVEKRRAMMMEDESGPTVILDRVLDED